MWSSASRLDKCGGVRGVKEGKLPSLMLSVVCLGGGKKSKVKHQPGALGGSCSPAVKKAALKCAPALAALTGPAGRSSRSISASVSPPVAIHYRRHTPL